MPSVPCASWSIKLLAMLLVSFIAALALGQDGTPPPGQDDTAEPPLFLTQDEDAPLGPASLVPS